MIYHNSLNLRFTFDTPSISISHSNATEISIGIPALQGQENLPGSKFKKKKSVPSENEIDYTSTKHFFM